MLYYDIQSNNQAKWSQINACLPLPHSRRCNMIVSTLSAKWSFIVLDETDYITINDIKINIDDKYTSFDESTFLALMNKLFTDNDGIDVQCEYDATYRLNFIDSSDFIINDASYRMKLIIGAYSSKFPLNSTNGKLLIDNVGYFSLTPIFYLISNYPTSSYTLNNEYSRVVMKITNRYSPNTLMIESNAEYITQCDSTILSNVMFELVDANMKPLEFLSPIYLSLTVEPVAEEVDNSISEYEMNRQNESLERLKNDFNLIVELNELKQKVEKNYLKALEKQT